uniref:Uncharacterized protein n=1 Tax=viral metagenome TaxID=1070528 RepID=A0A6C0IW00_9ZZZZ
MSENLVNQLTLNYMISKQQLAKLNKRIKNDNDNIRQTDKQMYRERIINLFNNLLDENEEEQEHLLTEDVKYAFTCFIDKSIYFFKQCDKCDDLEKERNNQSENENENEREEDDLDLESEDKHQLCKSDDSMESNDSQEYDSNEIPEEEIYVADNKNAKKNFMENIDDIYPDIQLSLDETQDIIKKSNVVSKKKTKSQGVEDINDIQVNWFQNVQQQYKSNKIIPRKKDIIIAGHYHNK